MPLITPEDVSTTRRGALSPRRRLQVWERTGGTCVICDQRIDGVRERWIVEHMRALELGGVDAIENMGPAHETCGRTKTRDDHARTAQAKRQKLRHLGATTTARPLPGSRATALKRKINGMVVPRTNEAQRACTVRRSTTSLSTSPAQSTRTGWSVGCQALPNQDGSRTNSPGASISATEVGPSADGCAQPSSPPDGAPTLPRDLAVIFDSRPLAPEEEPGSYDTLRKAILSQLKPADLIEAIWARDIVDLTWEVWYLRQARAQILIQARLAAVQHLIKPVIEIHRQRGMDSPDRSSTGCLALGWISGAENERSQVDQLLQERGLTASAISAKAVQLTLCDIERVSQMLTSAQQQRDVTLGAMARRRASLAQPNPSVIRR